MSRTTQTITIASGGVGRVAIAGDGFAVTESNLAVFQAAVDGDSFDDFRQGWSYSPAGGFEVLAFKNPSLSALTLEVVIWAGEFADRRFSTTGNVTTIPREDLADLVEAPGYVIDEAQGAVAAQFARLQLYNPVASGVLIVLKHVIAKTTGTAWAIRRFDTQFGSATSVEVNPLDTRAPAAKAELTRDNVVGGSLTGDLLFSRIVTAGQYLPFDFPVPLKIAEGHGIFLYGSFANTDINGTFFFEEIPV